MTDLVDGKSEILDAQIRAVGEHALVMLDGEVDVSTVGALYEKLAQLASEGVCHVALNLAEVQFMDSTALSVIVTEHKRVEAMGGELIIFSPPHHVRRLFDVVGLTDSLNIRPVKAP